MTGIERVSSDTIYVISQLLKLEGEKVFSEETFRELWKFLTHILHSDQDTKLLEQLKKTPDDKDIQKEAKLRLKTCIEENENDIETLHQLNRAVGFRYSYYFITNMKFDTDRYDAAIENNSPLPCPPKQDYCLRFPDMIPMPPSAGRTIPKLAISRKESNRFVNTGFSLWSDPDTSLNQNIPLATGKQYLFYVNIGKLDKKSIDVTHYELPSIAAENPTITVIVFGFEDGIRVIPGADRGEMQIPGGEPGRVIRQPIPEGDPVPASKRWDSTLFFPVVMPDKAMNGRIRCNIYWNNILLQSRLVSAGAVENPPVVPTNHQHLCTVMDYSISGTLDPSLISQLETHRLSMLLNTNGDGTQSIFINSSDRHFHVTFGGEEIQNLIEESREKLQVVSWGNENGWREGFKYRFKDRQPDLDRLKMSLISLSKWGYEFYFKVYCRLEDNEDSGEDKKTRDTFEDQMSIPGYVQIAMRQSPNYILPAARFYDYPLNTTADEYDLCETFVKAFNDKNQKLEDCACFKGACPTRENMKKLQNTNQGTKCTTICPSGFWGFRHFLGMPITLHEAEHSHDIPPCIPVRENVTISACIATNMILLGDHEKALNNLRTFGPSVRLQFADEEAEVIEALRGVSPHIVYFYCHGDLSHGVLQLHLGSKEHPVILNDSNLMTFNIIWTDPRPLVFINGCETAGLEPKQALNFIEPLFKYSNCAGVIGTEITIFEELATKFSEQFFDSFLAGEPVGKAIRHARLALLKEGNPLGLVYNPYVIPSLRLSKAGNGGQ